MTSKSVAEPAPLVGTKARPVLSIQYLRAFAALLVVFHHARNPEPWLFNPLVDVQLGARGVDVFFVISGFIMYTAARNEPVLTFIYRRIMRVVPLYWLATFALIAVGLASGEAFSRLNILCSLLLIPFHNPSHEGQIWPLLVPGWTLMYEMFFYTLFAIALTGKRLVATVTGAIAVLVILGWLFRPTSAILSTYTSPRMLEFVFGIWLGVAFRRARFPTLWPLLPLGVTGLPLTAIFSISGFWAGFIPAAMIVTGALALETRVTVPEWRFGKLVGDASYSIYLTHTILMFATNKIVASLPMQGWPQILTMIFLTLAASIGVGIIVYLSVECPIVKALNSLWAKPAAVTLASPSAP